MTAAHRCHDLSDRVWPRWELLLLGGPGKVGRPRTIAGFWTPCFGFCAPGCRRDLPPDSGNGQHTHRRFRRWRDRGVWAALWAAVRDAPDCAAWLIDARPIKVHPQAAGTQGGHLQRARTKGG